MISSSTTRRHCPLVTQLKTVVIIWTLALRISFRATCSVGIKTKSISGVTTRKVAVSSAPHSMIKCKFWLKMWSVHLRKFSRNKTRSIINSSNLAGLAIKGRIASTKQWPTQRRCPSKPSGTRWRQPCPKFQAASISPLISLIRRNLGSKLTHWWRASSTVTTTMSVLRLL